MPTHARTRTGTRSRSATLQVVTATLAILAASSTAAAQAQGTERGRARPNVLLILADDLGYSDLGCYGGEIPTPHLDRLAAGGVRFSQFYTSARCCPSRAALLTGLHPHQAGIGSFTTRKPRAGAGRAYAGHLLEDCATLAEHLGRNGYSTWMVGKWHLGTPGPIERGFEHYQGFRDPYAYSADQWDPDAYVQLPSGAAVEGTDDSESFYATDAFTTQALSFLQRAREDDAGRPWFLYLAHSAPHFPVQAPASSIDRHVPTYRRGWDVLREERLARMQAAGLVDPRLELPPRSLVPVDRDELTAGYAGQRNPAWSSLDSDRREDLARRMATFAAMVEHVDRGIGDILADLEAHGELDNTLIAFLSDNGACYEWGPFGFDGPSRRGGAKLHRGAEIEEIGQAGTWQSYGSAWAALGNTPLRLYKHFCHEGGIASPLILHVGGVTASNADTAGRIIETPTHLMDLVPTVLEATGITAARTHPDGTPLQPLEGQSLIPLVRGEELAERSLAFEHQRARALRRGRYKVVFGKRMPEAPRWQLYDMQVDRAEQRDLSELQPERTAALVAEWEAWARRVGAQPFLRDDLATDSSDTEQPPRIADRELVVRCRIAGNGQNAPVQGVVIAQGGRQQGFAVHFSDGVPCFDVRRNGAITSLRGDRVLAIAEATELVATLNRERMTLALGDGTPLGSRNSPGLIPSQPTDPRETGRDTRTAAGDYEVPNRFNGRVLRVTVEAAPPRRR